MYVVYTLINMTFAKQWATMNNKMCTAPHSSNQHVGPHMSANSSPARNRTTTTRKRTQQGSKHTVSHNTQVILYTHTQTKHGVCECTLLFPTTMNAECSTVCVSMFRCVCVWVFPIPIDFPFPLTWPTVHFWYGVHVLTSGILMGLHVTRYHIDVEQRKAQSAKTIDGHGGRKKALRLTNCLCSLE